MAAGRFHESCGNNQADAALLRNAQIILLLSPGPLPRPVAIRLASMSVRRPYNSAVPSEDRKSTRLNSSHGYISYAVFCLKKKKDTPVSVILLLLLQLFVVLS